MSEAASPGRVRPVRSAVLAVMAASLERGECFGLWGVSPGPLGNGGTVYPGSPSGGCDSSKLRGLRSESALFRVVVPVGNASGKCGATCTLMGCKLSPSTSGTLELTK